MEDLIPLIIVIAISIIGAVGRKKKRQEGRNISRPQYQTRRDDEIFSWLEKVGIEKEDISPFLDEEPYGSTVVVEDHKEPPVNHTETREGTTPNKYAQFGGVITPEEREQMMAREGVSAIKRKNVLSDQPQQVRETEEPYTRNTDIDLRQAVIYSEILNRKYA